MLVRFSELKVIVDLDIIPEAMLPPLPSPPLQGKDHRVGKKGTVLAALREGDCRREAASWQFASDCPEEVEQASTLRLHRQGTSLGAGWES